MIEYEHQPSLDGAEGSVCALLQGQSKMTSEKTMISPEF